MSPRSPRSCLLALLLAAALALPWAAASQDEGDEETPAEDVSPALEAARSEDVPEVLELEKVDLEELTVQRTMVAMRDRLRPRVSRYLGRAQKENDAGRPKEAEALLLKIQESRLNDLERAYVARLLGFLAYNDGRAEDAIKFFQQSLDTEAMQVREDVNLRFGIAQLYMGIGEWQKSIDWFRESMRYTDAPDANNYYVMAIAFFQLKQFDQALAHTLKAIETSPPPKESWLRLLSALYAQEEKYQKAIPVLEELVVRYPQRQYWIQLSLMYAASNEFPRSLAVQQAAYEQGFLVEGKELLRLARSYLYQDLPYPAAKLLSDELAAGRVEGDAESYELLANSWIAAREYEAALPPLQQAAELSETGKLFVRLGQVHMQREEWDNAVQMLHKAVEKGGLEKPGNAQVLLGIGYLNQERTVDATRYFERARGFPDSREEAERWLEHIAKQQANAA